MTIAGLELGTIAALLTAGGVGSAIAYWFTSARERRETRADALRALVAAERARQSPVQIGYDHDIP